MWFSGITYLRSWFNGIFFCFELKFTIKTFFFKLYKVFFKTWATVMIRIILWITVFRLIIVIKAQQFPTYFQYVPLSLALFILNINFQKLNIFSSCGNIFNFSHILNYTCSKLTFNSRDYVQTQADAHGILFVTQLFRLSHKICTIIYRCAIIYRSTWHRRNFSIDLQERTEKTVSILSPFP